MSERNPPPDWIPGENCDLILAHANHEPVPLVCAPTRYDPTGSRVRIHYEVYPNEDPNGPPRKIRHLWFRALIAERVLAPDGSFFPVDGEALRRRLIRILREEKDLTLTTRAGTILGLYGKDHVVIRSIYAEAETLEIHLSTLSLNDLPPAAKDTWLAEALNARSRWGTAVWR